MDTSLTAKPKKAKPVFFLDLSTIRKQDDLHQRSIVHNSEYESDNNQVKKHLKKP